MQENKRGSWGSNFGFLMAAIGSAVGLGNIWGFPYKMGKNGGFAFLIIYLLLVVFVGIAIMLGELALGRKTGLAAVGAYGEFSKKHKWVGYLGVISAFVILAFYCVLGGMVMRYMMGFLLQILGLDSFVGQGSGFFGFLLYDHGGMLFFFGLFMIINMLIVAGGVQKGIERFSMVGMPALFVILLFVVVFVAFQPGAIEGYKFMLKPNLDVFSNPEIGFLGVLKAAAGQMFFSLSLGMGAMITYGSYLSKKENLQRNALIIPFADTLIAVLAGFAVMPACAAFGVDYGGGPGLLFVSMHTVFEKMGNFGAFVGFLFYFLVFIAAVTSSISLLEVCTANRVDKAIAKGKEPNRKKITFIYGAIIFIVGLPVALDALGSGGSAIKAPYEILGITAGDVAAGFRVWNDCWLDLYDAFSEGVLMPLGALFMSFLIGWKYKPSTVFDECEQNGNKFRGKLFFTLCFKFVVPVAMLFVLWGQVKDFFF
ncbi:MAG: sodium-dependent transporter [Ruminococcaceae bacterium]|nr:sodium-dependent transporter [Oscillospiraceae bacterium]